MHVLIVTAHPNPQSLSHGVAQRIADGFASRGSSDTVEIVDLASEGFDPRFTAADIAVHRQEASPPADVVAEQARLDRADKLVLVYPVYWWSMPALLKGWIDRVFSNGWAFDFSLESKLVKKLQKLTIHLVAVAGADANTYRKRGYQDAMTTQIDHGIFDYCGASVVTNDLLVNSETTNAVIHLDRAFELGQSFSPLSAASVNIAS
ncbi:NAD(P)H-dependent oxidoreductase [Kordiimonas sp.]|uniref:NAD(P)H-dependent oxidoreductase n=1 Tax=Kordiimonas sp. TaxID=1970157 RepID=UPI003A935459